MDEKKLLDQIRQSAKEIETPDSLEPENMIKRLAGQPDEKETQQERNETAGESGEKRTHRWKWSAYAVRTAGLAAAAAVLFVAGKNVGVTYGIKTAEERLAAQEEAAASENTEETAQESTVWEESSTAETMQENAAREETEQTAEEEKTGEEAAASGTDETESAEISGAAPAGSGAELYKRLKECKEENKTLLYSTAGTAEIAYEDSAAADADTGVSSRQSAAAASDYSQTNLRDASVDEGDVVKTDGAYLYIMQENNGVQIVSADGEKLELVSTIAPEEWNETLQELYVDGDRLYLVTGGSKSTLTQAAESEDGENSADVYQTETYEYARLSAYDITDRENPTLLGSVEQEGNYQGSRKSGDYVYLFTRYDPQLGDTEEDSDIAPLVGGETLSAERIYLPDNLQDTGYLVISSVNVEEPDKVQDCAAVVSGTAECYVSGKSVYLYSQTWEDGSEKTDILKFSYQDGEISGAGACRIDGYLNDSFSLDEYDGYLRVVATSWTDDGEEENTLLIFDSQMNLTGRIADIAQGETLRSARFIGNAGYFVTFRQTDPLFSVDLSDPENPKILGELKISGFSSYLHVYGEDLLLGIGYEADEDTGETTGIKLSMFDISDPSNVKELCKYVIDGASSSPAFSDYRAVTIDAEKNVIGFVCDDQYVVFTYDAENGFENQLIYSLSGGKDTDWWESYGDVRGLYIGTTFYLADPDMIRAFDMEDQYTQTGKLAL